MSRAIPFSEVTYHHSSYADPNGFLFFWQGGLYRSIRPAYAGTIDELYRSGAHDELRDRGLIVQSELTDMRLGDSAVIIKHQRLPYVTYPSEWSTSMLKDAALAVLDMEMVLARHQLTALDVHPWNVLFNWCTPTFVDICALGQESGSVTQGSGSSTWGGFSSFRRFFLLPLLLALDGQGRLARLCFVDEAGLSIDEFTQAVHPIGKSETKLWELLYEDILESKRWAPIIRTSDRKQGWALRSYRLSLTAISRAQKKLRQMHWRAAARKWHSASRFEFLERLRAAVLDLPVAVTRGPWSTYYESTGDARQPPDPTDEQSLKLRNVQAAFERLAPETVLDVGSNTGFYSQVAVSYGAAVMAIDGEVSCIEDLYRQNRGTNNRLGTAVIDVKNPTPAYGPVNRESPSCFTRLQSDLVMMLAISHHLAHKNLMTFDQMLDSCASWSKRWVLFEYIDPTDEHVRDWGLQAREWYNFESLVHGAERKFRVLTIETSYPSSRKLLLLEKH